MTNIELLAEDILRMKHRDKILQALPLFLSKREPITGKTVPNSNTPATVKEETAC